MAPDRGTDALLWLLHFLFYRWVASVVHEAAHLLALMIATGPFESVSPFFGILTWRNLRGLLYTREVTANGLSSRAGALVRHAGWIASCALAAVLFLVGGANASWAARLGAAATALDALTSDLLLAGKRGGSCECARGGGGRSRWVFRCGNFGIILLNPEYRDIALEGV
ncbi:hypothetical protein T484DRAFT_1854250 [Baffinella frigidus]|nr:hypothetical protein T484DRAFT_1854250 [Cryptophyta sp. CCMP2293]